jgi:hypothetical protein
MVDQQAIDGVRAHMRSVKSPSPHEKVYKEECMFSYDTPESPGGIFINLQSFQVPRIGQRDRPHLASSTNPRLLSRDSVPNS